jgi:DNA-binding PadR family transcriptional regulator
MTNTELAILGLVAEQPSYGYQIEQSIEERGMRAWTEIGFSSIYYILNKLETAGWLESHKEDESERPARKVYQLTPAGQAALHTSVLEHLSNPRPRSGDFDLALANLALLAPDEIKTGLQAYRQQLETRLETVTRKWQAVPPADLPPAVHALFSHSHSTIRAELEWVTSFLSLP